MKLHIRLLLLFWIGLAPIVWAQPAALQGLDEYVQAALEAWEVPGLAIAVVKDDVVIYEKGFGMADVGAGSPVDEHTQFAIASNSKAFTATAIGLLVEEGKLDWDDPVLSYLPGFQLYDPVATRKLTIRDLLCHRAGLGTWGGDLTWFGTDLSREEILERIRYQEPVYDFRTGYRYNNLMFLLAGQVVAKVSGQSWDDFVKTRFFAPLGMTRSITALAEMDNFANVSKAYTRHLGENHEIPYRKVDGVGPAASIQSTVHDLAQWVRMQLDSGRYEGRRIVSPETLEETRKPHNLLNVSAGAKRMNPHTHFSAYGLGWVLFDYHGRKVVTHSGGMDGMYSRVGMIPEENLGVIVLTNRDNHSLMNALVFEVYDRLMGLEKKDWSELYLAGVKKGEEKGIQLRETLELQLNRDRSLAREAAEYTGTYYDPVYGQAKVSLREAELILTLEHHEGMEAVLKPWKGDTFIADWNDIVFDISFVQFEAAQGGNIHQFRTQVRPDWIDTHEYTFVKLSSSLNE